MSIIVLPLDPTLHYTRPTNPVSFPSKSLKLKVSLATIGSADDGRSVPRGTRAMPRCEGRVRCPDFLWQLSMLGAGRLRVRLFTLVCLTIVVTPCVCVC